MKPVISIICLLFVLTLLGCQSIYKIPEDISISISMGTSQDIAKIVVEINIVNPHKITHSYQIGVRTDDGFIFSETLLTPRDALAGGKFSVEIPKMSFRSELAAVARTQHDNLDKIVQLQAEINKINRDSLFS